MQLVDFSPPEWLLIHYYSIGSISIVLNAFAAYLLIFHCSKLGTFRYYLLVFQLLCAFTDIDANFLVQPVLLLPIPAGYTASVIASLFGISAHVCVALLVQNLLLQMAALLLCFLMKHQGIAVILNYHTFPVGTIYLFYFGCLTTLCAIGCLFEYASLSEEDQWKLIIQNYPDYIYSFRHLANFELFVKSTSFLTLLSVAGVESTFVAISVLLLTFDMFQMMNVLKTKISSTAFHKHQHAMKSLLVQFATSLLCILPPTSLTTIVFFEVPNAQFFAAFLTAWTSAHSSISVICLMIYFPPFNKFIVESFKKNRRRVSVPASNHF
ncbi:unnamed protein product [Caenorhabditis sp. 36 PRJEB53466]|nr:unnamed protein product [Caenorhabditis sp. 36 PRJEB53466]